MPTPPAATSDRPLTCCSVLASTELPSWGALLDISDARKTTQRIADAAFNLRHDRQLCISQTTFTKSLTRERSIANLSDIRQVRQDPRHRSAKREVCVFSRSRHLLVVVLSSLVALISTTLVAIAAPTILQIRNDSDLGRDRKATLIQNPIT